VLAAMFLGESQSTASNASAVVIGRKKSKEYVTDRQTDRQTGLSQYSDPLLGAEQMHKAEHVGGNVHNDKFCIS